MRNRPRTCSGCRGKFDRNALLRVAKMTENGASAIKFDPEVKLQGRGAWVCGKIECIEKARKSRVFERMLKAHAAEEVYGELLSCAM